MTTKVMVMVKASAGSEAGEMPSKELLAAMSQFNQELADAGILLSAEGLHPSSKGVRVRFSGKSRTVIGGPFMETKELVAGFWLWQVQSIEEAITWVKRCPNPMTVDSDIEIRPVFEADDFGESFTPELREHEASMRAKVLGLGTARFENRGTNLIAGLNEHYTLESRTNIPLQWERLLPCMNNIPGRVDNLSYGVCWNRGKDCSFDYLAGVEVRNTDNLPAEFSHIQLSEQRYAVFSHNQHVSLIAQTIDSIWSQWVPACGLEIADSPGFERYTEEFNINTGLGGMEIWIPLAA